MNPRRAGRPRCRPGAAAVVARRALLPLLATGALFAAACATSGPAPGAARAGGGSPLPRSTTLDGELLGAVPGTAEAVVLVDMRRLHGSPWARPLLAWAAERERSGEGGRTGRGFDEVADVDRWIFARVAGPGGARGTLEVARGRFDADRVLGAFRERRPGARGASFTGLAGAADVDGDLAVVLLDQQTVAFGPGYAVQGAALAARARGPSARGAPWLTGLARALDAETGGPVEGAALEIGLQVGPEARPALAETLGSEAAIERLAGRLVLDQGGRLALVALLPDAGQASALADRLGEQLRALAERRSLRALGLGPVLGRGVAEARGSRVRVELEVSADERAQVAERLATLAQLLAARREAPPAP